MNMKPLFAAILLCTAPFSAFAINYSNSELSGKDFSRQDLSGSSFVNTQLLKSDFSGSNLDGSEFSNGSLAGSSLAGASLKHASFVNLDFTGVDMRGADFTGASFTNCNLDTAISDKSTIFKDAQMVNTSLPGKKSAAVRNTTSISSTVVSTNQTSGPMDIVVNTGGVNVDIRNPGMHIKVGQSGSGNVTRVTTPGSSIVVGTPAPREYKSARAIADELKKPNARVDLTVNFEFDSDKILAEGHKQVFAIAEALKDKSLAGRNIRIEGHTDSKGTDDYNIDLSYRRAVSVMNELSQKYDVNTAALTVKGYGESQPIADNGTDDGRALNRRVTLVNVGQALLD